MPGMSRICDAVLTAEQMKVNGGRPLKVAPVGPDLKSVYSKKPTSGQTGALQSGRARRYGQSPPMQKKPAYTKSIN